MIKNNEAWFYGMLTNGSTFEEWMGESQRENFKEMHFWEIGVLTLFCKWVIDLEIDFYGIKVGWGHWLFLGLWNIIKILNFAST